MRFRVTNRPHSAPPRHFTAPNAQQLELLEAIAARSYDGGGECWTALAELRGLAGYSGPGLGNALSALWARGLLERRTRYVPSYAWRERSGLGTLFRISRAGEALLERTPEEDPI